MGIGVAQERRGSGGEYVVIGKTLDELIADVRAELSEEDTAFFTDENVTAFLNRGQDVIATDCPWACVATYSVASVANQPRYLMPLNVIHPTATFIRDSGGTAERTNYVEPDILDRLTSYSSTAGAARSVSYRNTNIGMELQLYPAPSTSGLWIDVNAHVRPTPMSATTDRTCIDPLFGHVLVNYALWKCKWKDEESPQGDRYRQDFEESLRDMEARRIIKQFDQFNRTRGHRSVTRRIYGRP